MNFLQSDAASSLPPPSQCVLDRHRMWCCRGCGGFVVLSVAPYVSPDKACETGAEEEEVSGFTAGLFPVEHGPMWTGVICPPWTPARSPHSPTKSLPERGSPLWGWLPVKVWPLCLKRISMEQRPGAAHGRWCVQYITSVCVCVLTLTQKVITSEHLGPPIAAHLFEFHWLGARIGLHPNVCVSWVCVCGERHAYSVALQTHKVNTDAALWPTLLLCVYLQVFVIQPSLPSLSVNS